jgi:hypothetical protein
VVKHLLSALAVGFTAIWILAIVIPPDHILAQPPFKVGDVVQYDEADSRLVKSPLWPGALECYGEDHQRDDLLRTVAILRDGGTWDNVPKKCERPSADYAYEIRDVADGVAPYDHIYCVNAVLDMPGTKTGCTWVTFPVGQAFLSTCKADRALTAAEIAANKQRAATNQPAYYNVAPLDNFPLPCLKQRTASR